MAALHGAVVGRGRRAHAAVQMKTCLTFGAALAIAVTAVQPIAAQGGAAAPAAKPASLAAASEPSTLSQPGRSPEASWAIRHTRVATMVAPIGAMLRRLPPPAVMPWPWPPPWTRSTRARPAMRPGPSPCLPARPCRPRAGRGSCPAAASVAGCWRISQCSRVCP